MSDPVLVALIGAGQAITIVLLGVVGPVLLRRVKRVETDTAVVRNEVKNHHTTNLRTEQDERHRENVSSLAELARRVDEGFTGIHHEFRALWGKAGSNSERIAVLENTDPTRSPGGGKHRKVHL